MVEDDIKPNSSYDYTGPERLKRMRENAKKTGGGRVEVLLDGPEIAYINRLIMQGEAKGRGAALKLLVRRAMDAEAANEGRMSGGG